MRTNDIDEFDEFGKMNDEDEEVFGNYIRVPSRHGAGLFYYLKHQSAILYATIGIKFKNANIIRNVLRKHEEYGLAGMQILSLVVATNDTELIKETIEKHKEYGIDTGEMLRLVISTQNTEYIKMIIEKREEYGCNMRDLVRLVEETEDTEYMKGIIEKHEEYGLDDFYIWKLAKAINDTEYMKELIEQHERYGIGAAYIVELAKATNDTEYMKELIEQHEKYGITGWNMVKLAEATKDTEYKKKIIQQIIEKHEEYGIRNFDIATLALATKDTEYIKKVLQDYEKYGLSRNAKVRVLNEIGELENYLNENMKIKSAKEISLPEGMTVGIEIESEEGITKLEKFIPENWSQKDDRTLNGGGIEIVSPILSGKTHSVEEIYKVCAILEATGHVTSERCGGHVHIGADYLTSVESYKNLMEIWANSENILYTIGNKEGELLRSGAGIYAQPISKKMELALESGEVDLENESDLRQFVSKMSRIQENRFSGINFKNTLSEGKNTIEFRISNGTIDPDTWVENINLYGGIVKSAQDLSIIQKKGIGEQTEEDANKLRLFEILKSENSSPEDKLEALLGLTIKVEQRDIYRERYRTNSRMLKEMPEKEQEIAGMISDKTLTVNKIGKAVFTGENAITGDEYMAVEGQMNALRARENEQEKTEN